MLLKWTTLVFGGSGVFDKGAEDGALGGVEGTGDKVIVSIVEMILLVLVSVKVVVKQVLEEHNEKDFIHQRPRVPFH